MRSFEHKVAAVTGAGSGIGRSLCVELMRQGCSVAASDINEAGLAETVRLAQGAASKPASISSHRLDVSKCEEMHAWADAVVAKHGKVNMIFNNAGVAHGATIEAASYADFEWIMGINFWGVVYGTKAFLPHLKAAGEEGHVINISSVFGLIAVPTQGTYNASKFAVRGFTEALRQELEIQGSLVSASSVHPGGIMTNIARSARVDDSAESITGQNKEESLKSFEKLFRTPPEVAAKVILKGVEKNARRVLIGADARLIDWAQRLLPTGYQTLLAALVKRQKHKK